MKTILIKPLVTEKNTMMAENLNQYVFEVAKDTNKIEIGLAVEKKFNVRVMNVRTSVNKGKAKSQFTKKGRREGFRSDRKKAIVTLHKEDKIDFFGTAEA